ncbi:MAG: hypothetical protein A2W34_02135 [Chloroflexi bacterium RBG_16_64_32]|nr:MAG: hypothetical protein A2W34_02135 [Chloroflexi bacterium RBG_16_64_32]
MKTLANLGSLYVHYAYCDDVLKKEQLMLKAFADNLSDETRAALYDATHVMPFANLVDGSGGRKLHGINGARAPRSRSTAPSFSSIGRQPGDAPARRQRATAAPAGSATADAYTQRITAVDIKQGRIRVPGATKALFPLERANVDVELRGERKSCSWNPRYDPDKQRSGVLGIGKALMDRLLTDGEPLRVRVGRDVIYLD